MTRIERLSIDCPTSEETAVMWRARGPRVAFQLATVLVMVAGCSNDSNRLANGSTMEDVAQAVPTASPAPYPVQATLSENVVVPDVFAGMWDFNEGEAFHDAAAEGILLIEGPCVYIIHDHIIYDYPWIPPPSEDPPDPIRIFLKLPRDQTSYDPDTETIQVHDQGPMASGDRVEAGGGGAGQSPPDICPADQVFTASNMSPKECLSWLSPEQQTGCKPPGPADPLAGMWGYDPALPSYAPAAAGVLLIEGPCVYVIDDFMWLVPGVSLEELPEPIRVFVNLPRAQTHYDPDTETIRVHDQEPMASGDRVQMAGGTDQSVPDACSAGVDRVFTATHMSPKQCLPWVPPERQTGCKPTETP